MGKQITSPIKQFPGSVTLFDPVPYPAYIAWEKAVDRSENDTQGEQEQALWAGVKAMTEEWNIDKFDINSPVASPRTAILKLLAWLIEEVGKVINSEDPN